MAKIHWKPGTMIYPLPSVLVSCGDNPENYNLITIAWTGIISTNPPICYISVRPERHSYQLIKNSMDFVINLTNKELSFATDWCGVKSGKDFDKFKEMNLNYSKSKIVKSPILVESPINIECKVKEIIPSGSHHMFLSEIVNVSADDKYLDSETGAFDLSKSQPISYCHGSYFELGKQIGKFGFSVKKPIKSKNKIKK